VPGGCVTSGSNRSNWDLLNLPLLGMAGGPGRLPPSANPALQAAKQATRRVPGNNPGQLLRQVNRPAPPFKWINEKAKILFDLIETILEGVAKGGSGESVVPFLINPSPCGTSPSLNSSGLPNGGCT